jgi:hypothetical protein
LFFHQTQWAIPECDGLLSVLSVVTVVKERRTLGTVTSFLLIITVRLSHKPKTVAKVA